MENINHTEIENLKRELGNMKKEHEKFDDRIRKIETSKEKTEFQYEEIMKALNKLNDQTIPRLISDINELKNKPAKRYETIISAFISGVVAVIVSLLFKF